MERDRDAAVRLALELLSQLPTGSLAVESERHFGPAPEMRDEHGIVKRSLSAGAPSDGAPSSFSVAISRRGAITAVVRRRRCFCCDDDEGDGVAACAALRLLDSLHAELARRDEIVKQELSEGADEEVTQRGARWFMYRAFVAQQFGYLGPGVRVRIPDCVIAAIRDRYRAPGCACDLRAIITCTQYRGHRDT